LQPVLDRQSKPAAVRKKVFRRTTFFSFAANDEAISSVSLGINATKVQRNTLLVHQIPADRHCVSAQAPLRSD
jgi:hypothetical protein